MPECKRKPDVKGCDAVSRKRNNDIVFRSIITCINSNENFYKANLNRMKHARRRKELLFFSLLESVLDLDGSFSRRDGYKQTDWTHWTDGGGGLVKVCTCVAGDLLINFAFLRGRLITRMYGLYPSRSFLPIM